VRAGAGRARRLAAIAALACACSGAPEPIHVRSVRLAGDAPPRALAEIGLDGPGIEDAARVALAAAGFRTGDGTRPHAAEVSLAAVRVVPGGSAGPRAEVTVEIVLAPLEGGGTPRREAGTGAAPLATGGAPREAWRRAAGEASQRAAESLALGVRAEGKRLDGLVADLSAKDPRAREQAIRVLGERRSREAVPALVARIELEDARLGQRIVGALAQIGDPRAVPALIDLARAADPGQAGRLVRFIGDIGGPEAEGYLLTVASGHPDARVRRIAREALDEIAGRAGDPPAAAGGEGPRRSGFR
jgi:hypothetical protein